MSDRDDRYNASRKGQRRLKRFEQSAARKAYKARWLRAYRKRQKRGAA